MSNALFEDYGKATASLWFPNMKQYSCRRPAKDLRELDKMYPRESAIYFLCANKGISYIGISAERNSGGVFGRLREHWQNTGKLFRFCYAFGLPPELLGSWETDAIHKFQPEENNSKRDYKLSVNDNISGLPDFLNRQKYFENFGDRRIFRIDTQII